MSLRPLSITIIGWLFIGVGTVALVYHLLPQHIAEIKGELVWVCAVQIAAIVGGVSLLRGCNWARWLLVIWMGFHMVLSVLHSLTQVVVHGLLFGVIVWFLFRPAATAYFRERKAERRQLGKPEGKPVA